MYLDFIEFILLEFIYSGAYIGILYFISNILTNKFTLDVSSQYFILHFIHNMIITAIILPYCLTMISDPLGIKNDYTSYKDYYCVLFPMISGLHTFHLLKSYKKIQIDELLHHVITYVFTIINYILVHPFYYSYLIVLSGIPGGITYLLLFLQKFKLIKSLTEKKISYLLNVWVRAPITVAWAILAYSRLVYFEESNINKILILISMFFIPLNGIHFMTTIAQSYHKQIFYKVE
jgi:hypothetical protein